MLYPLHAVLRRIQEWKASLTSDQRFGAKSSDCDRKTRRTLNVHGVDPGGTGPNTDPVHRRRC